MTFISKNKGFTLAELLVAIALGLFLTAVVITIFLSSKASFRASEGLARAQENTRFSMRFLTRDIRMAGYSICTKGVVQRNFLNTAAVGYVDSIETAISGWEFDDTKPGDDYDLTYDDLDPNEAYDSAAVASARTNNFSAAGDYSNANSTSLPAAIAAFEPLAGSDIISVSLSELLPNRDNPDRYIIDTSFNRRIPQLNLVDLAGDATASTIEYGKIIKVGDCTALDIFQNVAASTNTFISPGGGVDQSTSPGNRIFGDFRWQKNWGENSTIFSVETKIFYVGTGASGSPALFGVSSECGLVNDCNGNAFQPAELVEGVENMQVLYGLAADDPADPDEFRIQYVTADDVTDFSLVRNVKLSLLMRSTNDAKDLIDTSTYELLGDTTINPPDDRLLRFVNNTTVQLYNRGL